jgi:hypothetical protein
MLNTTSVCTAWDAATPDDGLNSYNSQLSVEVGVTSIEAYGRDSFTIDVQLLVSWLDGA